MSQGNLIYSGAQPGQSAGSQCFDVDPHVWNWKHPGLALVRAAQCAIRESVQWL